MSLQGPVTRGAQQREAQLLVENPSRVPGGGGWVGVSCIYLCCTHRVGPRRLLHMGQRVGGQ